RRNVGTAETRRFRVARQDDHGICDLIWITAGAAVSDQRIAAEKSVVVVMSHVRLPSAHPQIGRSHPDSGRNARHSVYRASGLVHWHDSDVAACPLHVRCRRKTGSEMLKLSYSLPDPERTSC